MRVLYFGTYDRSAPRNAQVIDCLAAAGVSVIERHRQLWGRSAWSMGLRQLARVAAAERGLAREHEPEADVVLVGYPGHFDMPSARRVARGRPIVFNPLVSLYDTLVGDGARFRRGTPAAGLLRHTDRVAFRRADLVVADTEAQASFFRETFGLADDRVAVCLLGADDRLFRPGWHPEHPFHALFVDPPFPPHGADTVVSAAKLLPDVPFRIVGVDPDVNAPDGRPDNVEWQPWTGADELPAAYHAAGCVLGTFSDDPRAARAIPGHAFQALACGRPLITADTPAARELLRNGVDAVLVPPADAEALAESLARIAGDARRGEALAGAGRARYLERASCGVLGERWRALIEGALERR